MNFGMDEKYTLMIMTVYFWMFIDPSEHAYV